VNVPYTYTRHDQNPRGIVRKVGFDMKNDDTPNTISRKFQALIRTLLEVRCCGQSVSSKVFAETLRDQSFRAPEVIACCLRYQPSSSVSTDKTSYNPVSYAANWQLLCGSSTKSLRFPGKLGYIVSLRAKINLGISIISDSRRTGVVLR